MLVRQGSPLPRGATHLGGAPTKTQTRHPPLAHGRRAGPPGKKKGKTHPPRALLGPYFSVNVPWGRSRSTDALRSRNTPARPRSTCMSGGVERGREFTDTVFRLPASGAPHWARLPRREAGGIRPPGIGERGRRRPRRGDGAGELGGAMLFALLVAWRGDVQDTRISAFPSRSPR